MSSVTQNYSEVDWLIGREFWAFISGEPDFSRQLFDLIAEIVNTYSPDGGTPWAVRYEHKIQVLTEQIREKYGAGGEDMWERLFEDNM